MQRRMLRVVVTLVVCVVGGFVVVWLRPDRITEANLRRVSVGMTRKEVESVLGPPGDHSSGPLEYPRYGPYAIPSFGPPVGDFVLSSTLIYGVEELNSVEWRSDHQMIVVHFDPYGHVRYKECRNVVRVDQSSFDNFLWRAKRQWRSWYPEKPALAPPPRLPPMPRMPAPAPAGP